MRTLEAAALVNATDPLPRCLAEGTFAAQYLLKEDDLIPDSVPGVGLADDAILVKSVVARHGRELARSGWIFDCAVQSPDPRKRRTTLRRSIKHRC